MSANNGDNPRLDRIEKILEALTNVQQDMQQEHQMLLRAQIVMGEVVTKLGEKIDKLADAQKALAEHTDERFRDTDERLGALIKIVDELIRRPGDRI
jgi:phage-related minor tail protein